MILFLIMLTFTASNQKLLVTKKQQKKYKNITLLGCNEANAPK